MKHIVCANRLLVDVADKDAHQDGHEGYGLCESFPSGWR